MKIAIATDFYSPWIGGPATFIENFSVFLTDAGHDVTIIAPSPGGAEGIERQGAAQVRRLPTVPVPFGYRLRVTADPSAAGAALRAIRPDVVQIHHPFPLGLTTMRAAAALGIPVVAVNHTIPECSLYGIRDRRGLYPFSVGAFRRYLVWFLRQATAIATPTETAATLLRRMGLGRPVTVISNGIDTARFHPTSDPMVARALLNLPAKDPIILYTGRLDAEKDMPTWIKAAALALHDTPAHLVIGGQGNDRPSLERLVEELGIAHRVTFPGYLPTDQLPTLYQAANIYCITSAVELQSITTLEALASGLPVVAARAGALPELVRDGVNGYLAQPGDVGACAAALGVLLRRPEERRTMGTAGRVLAEEHSLPTVAQRHERLLSETARAAVGRAGTA